MTSSKVTLISAHGLFLPWMTSPQCCGHHSVVAVPYCEELMSLVDYQVRRSELQAGSGHKLNTEKLRSKIITPGRKKVT